MKRGRSRLSRETKIKERDYVHAKMKSILSCFLTYVRERLVRVSYLFVGKPCTEIPFHFFFFFLERIRREVVWKKRGKFLEDGKSVQDDLFVL